MNGVSRFLSRRDKKPRASLDTNIDRPQHHPHVPKELYRLFHPEDANVKKIKNEDQKIKDIIERLKAQNITDLQEEQCEYALKSRATDGDIDKTVELLGLFEDALHGTIRDYNSNTKLLGAENRELVSCYLDSLLFAMFSRFDSFEGLISRDFEDAERKKLVTIIRLWVNMLRSGKLITTDITKHLQEALGACGWEEATRIRQQDVSEAFTFITDKLELPLLTLKMDVYHTGKVDSDDHRIVKERLLDVAIPEPNADGSIIRLEDCLENYFNNRIEVRRHLQRRNTLQSLRYTSEKQQIMQIEMAECGPESPSLNPPPPFSPGSWQSQGHTPSIFSSRRMSLDASPASASEGNTASERKAQDDSALPTKRPRAATFRREVLMPAWQFFSLIPWTTADKPVNDVQVAEHLSSNRPVLGICLKRYSMTAKGEGTRRDTYIDIPTEIGLPHFISDESSDASNFSNFKLSLQSVICHRGKSLDSGHYISLVRGDAQNATVNPTIPPSATLKTESSMDSQTSTTQDTAQIPEASNAGAKDGAPANSVSEDHRRPTGPWMLFDDLAKERVTYVDIQKALKDECPYLLFYQVQPIDEGPFGPAPPSYDSIMRTSTSIHSRSSSDGQHTNVDDQMNEATDSALSLTTTSTPSLAGVEQPIPISLTKTRTRDPALNDTNLTLTADKHGLAVPIPGAPLQKSQSVNIGTLAHQRDAPLEVSTPRLNATSMKLKERPKSMDLTALDRQQFQNHAPVAATGSPQIGSNNVPDSRNSFSSARRSSVVFTDTSANGSIRGPTASAAGSVPITPSEELDNELGAGEKDSTSGSLRNAFRNMGRRRRGSSTGAGPKASAPNLTTPGISPVPTNTNTKNTRSRPVSQSGENRMSLNMGGLNLSNMGMGKLRTAMSKDKLADVNITTIPIEETDEKSKRKSGIMRGKSVRTSRKDKSEVHVSEKRRASSTNRLSAMLGQGNLANAGEKGHGSGERPDRECVVM